MELAMCELQGSPKQISWANDIRSRVVTTIQDAIKRYRKNNYPGRATVLEHGLPKLLSTKTQASWWIDRRWDKLSHWELLLERMVPEALEIYKQHGEVWIF